MPCRRSPGSAAAAQSDAEPPLERPDRAAEGARPRRSRTSFSRELAEIPQASGADLIDGADPGRRAGLLRLRLHRRGPSARSRSRPLTAEAHKTEPDKNTYLVLSGQQGRRPGLRLRHATSSTRATRPGSPGYITRINLDADRDHRVTLHGDAGRQRRRPARVRRLDLGPVRPDAAVHGRARLARRRRVADDARPRHAGRRPARHHRLERLRGHPERLGRQPLDRRGHRRRHDRRARPRSRTRSSTASCRTTGRPDEGRQAAGPAGRVARATRASRSSSTTARRPPTSRRRTPSTSTRTATRSTRSGSRSTTRTPTAPTRSTPTRWRRPTSGTPFKRPENGVFRPGTKFRAFAFTETGDTDIRTEAGSDGGGFGDVQVLEQKSPTADEGRLRLLFQGDAEHASFDNISWLSDRTVAVVEDRGDTFHSQGNGVQPTALDSAWAIDANVDHAHSDARPVRFIAEGRDASATVDSALARRRRARLHERRRQRADGDPHLRRRPDRRRDPRREGPGALRGRATTTAARSRPRRRPRAGLAGLLHPAARRQPHLGAGRPAVAA